MELLDTLLQRSVIVALAIAGAVVATLGSWLSGRHSFFSPNKARLVVRFGYAVTWLSVALFIVAGFRAGW